MSWERIAENRIREAMQQGEFDNLPGAGQPAMRRELTDRRTQLAVVLERARRA